MKTLFLIRHAKSSWKDLSLNDFDRPLNKRGKKDAPFMGNLLKGSDDIPDLFISSPAVRAWMTSLLIAKEISFDADQIVRNTRIYDATFQNLLELVYELEDVNNSVYLIGHNPGLTVLSNYLTDYYIDNIPTCGIVKMTFEIQSWKEIVKGMGSMDYFKYPKKYNID